MLNDTAISEIMTRHVITVTPNTLLDVVNDIFSKNDFHHIPVVEGEHLVGIISRSDIDRVTRCIDLFHSAENEIYNEKLFKSLLAEEVMTSNAQVVAPDDAIAYAASLFSGNKFHALPVVEGKKFVGLVTTFDLIDFAFSKKTP